MIADEAATNRIVVDNETAGILAAHTRTRVLALLIDARLLLATLGAEYALGPAIRRRTNHIGQTTADGVVVNGAALTVQAARRRMAWVFDGRFLD